MENFTAISNSIIDNHLNDLSASAIKVYIYLRRCSDINDKPSWPKVEKIAEITGYCERQVKRAIQELEALKLIFVHREILPSGHKKNTYHFLTPSDVDVTRPSDTDVQSQVTPVSKAKGHGSHYNNTNINNTNMNNNKGTTKVEVTVNVSINLENAVVAILKSVDIDEPEEGPFKDKLIDTPNNRLQAYATRSKSKKNPQGWFRQAVTKNYKIPELDKQAFEMMCDMIRSTSTHLISKASSKEYLIEQDRKGSIISFYSEERQKYITLTSEKQLEDYTWLTI